MPVKDLARYHSFIAPHVQANVAALGFGVSIIQNLANAGTVNRVTGQLKPGYVVLT